jgi:hypothetical protein
MKRVSLSDDGYRMPAALVDRLRTAPDVLADLQAVSSRDAQWLRTLSALDAFIGREGHARVPRGHTEAGFQLSSWVATNRKQKRAGSLPADRVARLERRTGWVWDQHQQSYTDGLSALDAFISREGHARVPRGHTEAGFRLDIWATNSRSQKRAGILPAERVEDLERRTGWVWNQHEQGYADGLSALDTFIDREGHARVPQGHIEAGFKLGIWVMGRRAQQRAGKLSADRIAALESRRGWSTSAGPHS